MTTSEHGTRKNPLSKAEKRALLTGAAFKHNGEDIEYWRAASDETRGQTLYQLLMLVNAIGRYPEKTEELPGFPRRSRPIS